MKRALVVALLCGVASPVAAQPAPAKTAEEHYEASKKLYNIEKYDEAIAELKQAYTLSPDPVYLFNIAQALRKKNDCAGALDYYRKYLRDSPDATNKAKVEQWMVELEACAKTQPKVVDPKPIESNPIDGKPVDRKPVDREPVDRKPVIGLTSDVKPIDTRPSGPPIADQPPRDSKRTLRIAGVATAGTGGVILIAGTLLALNARGISNEVESECNSTMGCAWDEASKRDDLGRRRATLSRLSFVVGGLAVVGGGVMFMLGRPTKREAPISIVPTGDGALVTFSGRY